MWLAQNPNFKSAQDKTDVNLSLSESINHFINAIKASNKAYLTCFSYQGLLSTFEGFMHTRVTNQQEVYVCDITRSDIEAFLARRNYEVSAGTYNTELAYLKSFFHGFLQEDGILQKAPTNRIRFKSRGEPLIQFLTKSQQQQILNRALANRESGARDFFIVFLALHTGLRLNEIANLNIDDINLSTGILEVLHPKGGGKRLSALDPEASQAIRDYLRQVRSKFPRNVGNERPLFMEWKSGGNLERLSREAIQKMIQRVFRASGITRGCTHRLRHSFAVNLLESGYNLVEIQMLLGHKRLSTTLEYLHLNNKNVLEKLNASFPLASVTISQALSGIIPVQSRIEKRVDIYDLSRLSRSFH